MINHATNNETVKIMVALYLASITNHGMMDEMMKMMDTRFIWHVQWTPSRIRIGRLKIIL